MAREEHARENLLVEATALMPRVELQITDDGEPVVVGFREGGLASFYFGDDPAYHFNSQLALRRAFAGGQLIKAEGGLLVALTRNRTATESQLVRHELSLGESAAFLAQARRRLHDLHECLASGRFQVMGEVPAGSDTLARVTQFLRELPPALLAAEAPNCA